MRRNGEKIHDRGQIGGQARWPAVFTERSDLQSETQLHQDGLKLTSVFIIFWLVFCLHFLFSFFLNPLIKWIHDDYGDRDSIPKLSEMINVILFLTKDGCLHFFFPVWMRCRVRMKFDLKKKFYFVAWVLMMCQAHARDCTAIKKRKKNGNVIIGF